MASNSPTLFDKLRDFWRLLAPDSDPVEPVVNVLDDWRTEFAWRGPPLTFDRRANRVMRRGHELFKLADIKSVDVTHVRADDDPEYWKVSLGTGMFSGMEIGRTADDVEASIAAARVSTVLGVKVRSL